jgi:hypothetical protein
MFKNFVGQVIPKSPMEYASHAMREVEAVMNSADRKEGMDSFVNKRAPRYQGR